MRALVLSGGGAKGSWQAGAAETLIKANNQYDAHFGVSVGALNSGHLSQYPTGQEQEATEKLIELWCSISNKDVRRYHNWLKWLAVPWKPSVYSAQPLRDFINAHLSADKIRTSGKTLGVGAVNLNTGAYEVHTGDSPSIVSAILASASYPIMFDPITIDGSDFYSDGGLRDVTPLKAAIDAGATKVDVIMCSPVGLAPWHPEKITVIKLIPRVLDLMMDEIIEDDLKQCTKANQRIKEGRGDKGHRLIELRIFRPKTEIPIDSLDFNPVAIRECIKLGRAYMREALSL